MKRDRLRAAPLYYVFNEKRELCFSLEVKGLIPYGEEIRESPREILFAKKKLILILAGKSSLPEEERAKGYLAKQ